jgi:hypothetical protein
MDAELLSDELEAAKRTIRLAQAQLSTLKRHFAKVDPLKTQEFESIEVMLSLILTKLEGATPPP